MTYVLGYRKGARYIQRTFHSVCAALVAWRKAEKAGAVNGSIIQFN